MKHYDTNDRYTEQKKHKGKYKGDEMKIHNSLPQPEQHKIKLLNNLNKMLSDQETLLKILINTDVKWLKLLNRETENKKAIQQTKRNIKTLKICINKFK